MTRWFESPVWLTRLLGGIAFTVFGLGAWAYLVALDLSLWHDEAFTVVNFIQLGPRLILFGTYTSNNHVLFSLLAWASSQAVGPSEVVYRFWSVVPALAAIAILGRWLWRRFDPLGATLFVILATVSPLHFQLARVARGYGLGLLATAGLLVFAHRMTEAQRRSDVVGVAVSGAIGVAALPIFVVPFLISLGIVGIVNRSWKRVGVAVISAGLVSAVPYLGRLGQLLDSSGLEFGTKLRWFEPLTAWVFHFLMPIGRLAVGQDTGANPGGTVVPTEPLQVDVFYLTLACFAVAFVAFIAFVRNGWGRERALVVLVVFPLFGTYIAVGLLRFYLVGRFVSFLSLLAIVGIALGISSALEGLRRRATRLIPVIFVGLGVVLVGLIFNFVSWAQEWHALPYENFKEAAAVALTTSEGNIYTDSRRDAGLRYYLGEHLAPVDFAALCSMSHFVFIHHPFRNSPPEAPCLVEPDVRSTTISQRGRGGFIEVFIRDPKPVVGQPEGVEWRPLRIATASDQAFVIGRPDAILLPATLPAFG